MSDTKLTALPAVPAPDLIDLLYLVDVSDTTDDAAGSSRQATFSDLLGYLLPFQGRLTTESTISVSTSDRTAQSTIYLTPYVGNRYGAFNGTKWNLSVIPEIGITLSGLTSGKGYDVYFHSGSATPTSTNTTTDVVTFASDPGWTTGACVRSYVTLGGFIAGSNYFYNSISTTTGSFHSTLANALAGTSKLNITANITQTLYASWLRIGAVWTNDTTRGSEGIVLGDDGCWMSATNSSGRLAGSFYTTGTTTTEDSVAKRYVWNVYNRVPRSLRVIDTTDTWTYGSAAWRYANNSSGNSVSYIVGLNDMLVESAADADSLVSATSAYCVGIGVDVSNANSAVLLTEAGTTAASDSAQTHARYKGYPGVGRHFLAWIEYARAGTPTVYGDAGVVTIQSGLDAVVWG